MWPTDLCQNSVIANDLRVTHCSYFFWKQVFSASVGQTTGQPCTLPAWPLGHGGPEFKSRAMLRLVGLCGLTSTYSQITISIFLGKEGPPVWQAIKTGFKGTQTSNRASRGITDGAGSINSLWLQRNQTHRPSLLNSTHKPCQFLLPPHTHYTTRTVSIMAVAAHHPHLDTSPSFLPFHSGRQALWAAIKS